MESNYSKMALDFISRNYGQIVNVKDFISISIGGSVARGYAQEKSDLDLICISIKEKKYKKIFKIINDFPIEVHIIPIQYIYILLENIKKFSNLDYQLPEVIDVVSMGAKKCNLIERNLDDILKLLSDWREIKKVSDSILLYENESEFLSNFKEKINNVKFNKKIYEKFEENKNKYSDIDKLINMFKIYSLYIGKIYSKVLWTDIYIDQDYNKDIKQTLLKNILIDKKNISEFYMWNETHYNELIKLHSSIQCDFCKNDYLQCNIMRCIHDYINDANKAKKNNFQLGEMLSIKKAIEYIFLLYKKLGIVNEDLERINKKIKISTEAIEQIWHLVREECESNVCN